MFEQVLIENGNIVYMSDSKGSCEVGQIFIIKFFDGSGILQLVFIGWLKNN